VGIDVIYTEAPELAGEYLKATIMSSEVNVEVLTDIFFSELGISVP